MNIREQARFHTRQMVMMLLILVGFAVYAALLLPDRALGSSTQSYLEVVVEPGDTLWGIATEYNQEGRDVRELLYAIRKVNGLKGEPLQVGDVLIVPTSW
jgi:nucleoid-associated protein YgaU